MHLPEVIILQKWMSLYTVWLQSRFFFLSYFSKYTLYSVSLSLLVPSILSLLNCSLAEKVIRRWVTKLYRVDKMKELPACDRVKSRILSKILPEKQTISFSFVIRRYYANVSYLTRFLSNGLLWFILEYCCFRCNLIDTQIRNE